MAITGHFVGDGAEISSEEIPIWRESIPEGNYWMGEGRNYLRNLTKEDIIWMLQRIPRARRDYLDAVNPERAEYVRLANVPLVSGSSVDTVSRGIGHPQQSIKFLWETCRGICPTP